MSTSGHAKTKIYTGVLIFGCFFENKTERLPGRSLKTNLSNLQHHSDQHSVPICVLSGTRRCKSFGGKQTWYTSQSKPVKLDLGLSARKLKTKVYPESSKSVHSVRKGRFVLRQANFQLPKNFVPGCEKISNKNF